MKCAHCDTKINVPQYSGLIIEDDKYLWSHTWYTCPECKQTVITVNGANKKNRFSLRRIMVYPKSRGRPPLPKEVPTEYTEDYIEACLVLQDSPKASAALSRRCLQHLLRNKVGVKESDLYNEIQEVLDSGQLPSNISDDIDAIRNIGKFAAHPNKSTKTGEIMDVEPGEAEWNLEILELLFDFYFVQPEKKKKRRAMLNQKLQEAGAKTMKKP